MRKWRATASSACWWFRFPSLTEHIETLHEINIEAREHAEALGVTDFHMMPALNDSPLLIRALADLVLRSVGMRAGVASVAS